ncbi:hypothetical protein QWY84_15375 [Aquisalimonas lutea]|uniref:hypothetical protein n=1 Tax=Aquisalimonas lutea TaxID=1327750 RepID=UPI0025B569D1|nr:hypothetical protein [Aquisalimonas lutea]MDN3518998.1 hypothetical protein [Aquisalimonas lutea]
MDDLIREFKATWRRPWPVHPAVHRPGPSSPAILRWRPSGVDGIGQGPVVFTSDQVQRRLESANVPAETRRAWAAIDRRAQVLNVRARLLFYEYRRLTDYVEHIRCLNALEETWQAT